MIGTSLDDVCTLLSGVLPSCPFTDRELGVGSVFRPFNSFCIYLDVTMQIQVLRVPTGTKFEPLGFHTWQSWGRELVIPIIEPPMCVIYAIF